MLRGSWKSRQINFAAELLITDEKLESLQCMYDNISNIAWELLVSEQLVEIRLKNFKQ